jgi:2-desacetyl-2-hydroxyethyl bacteriochlorophyllide A dehydrogenase
VRAVRLAGIEQLEVIELPDPVPSDDEVLVRVSGCGICGSDLSCYKTGVFSGSVLGHEFAGWIESAAAGFEAGEPVVVDPKMPCGVCADCRAGAGYRCAEGLARGMGGLRNGAYAEFVVAPASSAYRLPSGLAVEDACLVEPLSVAIHGIGKAEMPVEEAIVVGLGPIGLLAVAALRAAGCETVTGIDPVEIRRSLATSLGATAVVSRVEDAPTDVPLVLECSGRAEVLQSATNLLASGGRAVLLGVPMSEATIVPMVWVTREQSVVGAISSSVEDFREAISLLAARPEIAAIITRRVSLDELPAAFDELVHQPAEGKVVVDPSS